MASSSSSSIHSSRSTRLAGSLFLSKTSLLESKQAIQSVSDCGEVPQDKRRKQASEEEETPFTIPLIEDRVEVSDLSAEALRQTATLTEQIILTPSSALKQAYRMSTPLNNQDMTLENTRAESNWSVYSAHLT